MNANWTYVGVSAGMRFFIGYSGTIPTAAQLNTFATQFQGSVASHWAPMQAVNVIYNLFEVTDLSSTTGAIGSSSTSTPGTRTGSGTAANVCTLMNFHVARRYRGGKPRVYIPWGTSTDVTSPTNWTPTFISAATAAWSALISDLTVVPWSGATISGQVNVSYYEGFKAFEEPSGRYKNIPQLRPGGPVKDAITSVACNPKFGTQRRRVAA